MLYLIYLYVCTTITSLSLLSPIISRVFICWHQQNLYHPLPIAYPDSFWSCWPGNSIITLKNTVCLVLLSFKSVIKWLIFHYSSLKLCKNIWKSVLKSYTQRRFIIKSKHTHQLYEQHQGKSLFYLGKCWHEEEILHAWSCMQGIQEKEGKLAMQLFPKSFVQ